MWATGIFLEDQIIQEKARRTQYGLTQHDHSSQQTQMRFTNDWQVRKIILDALNLTEKSGTQTMAQKLLHYLIYGG